MEKEQKIKSFEEELKFIVNPQIKLFAETAIGSLPDYMFHIPASSSSKYHAMYALGDGGLLRHVKAATRIAVEMFRLDWWHFTEDEKDLILVSLMLHDGWKSDVIQQKYSVATHPIIAVEQLSKNVELRSLITKEQFEFVCDCIIHHMGQFVFDYRTKEKVLDKPVTRYAKFVHLMDYICSRRCVEFNFDVEIVRE